MLAVDASRCSHSPDFQEMHLNGRTAMTFYDPRGQKTRKIPSVTQLLCISGSNLEFLDTRDSPPESTRVWRQQVKIRMWEDRGATWISLRAAGLLD